MVASGYRAIARSCAVAALLILAQTMVEAATAQPTGPGAARSAAPSPAAPPRTTRSVALEAGTGRVIDIPRAAASIFVVDPRVAEVRPASPTTLFVFGVAPGRTTVAAMDATGLPVAEFDVTVRPSAYAASETQSATRGLGPSGIQVIPRPNGVALVGEVNTPAEAERAVAIARSFLEAGQTVDNRLTVRETVQVNLRVRFVEVGRDVARQFGIDWEAIGRTGRISFSLLGNPAGLVGNTLRLGARYASTSLTVDAVIDALAQDRLVHVLAEPNLTAMSGEPASFLAGGEFPIPIVQRENQIGVEFRQYGVSLTFVPTVNAENRITLRVRPEVSELTEVGAVQIAGFQIPALTVRRAETTIELGSGQSFAIAGLLSDSARKVGRSVPWVGEVPVLGALFRSDRFQRAETELVIVVTPFVVRPVSDPTALRFPGDGQTLATNDADRILFFRHWARTARAPPMTPPGAVGYLLD